MRLALGAHALDLLTFLALAPIAVAFGVELGPIGRVYLVGGLLLSVAFKAAGLSFAFSMIRLSGRPRLVGLLAWAGVIGAASNVLALWQLRSVL